MPRGFLEVWIFHQLVNDITRICKRANARLSDSAALSHRSTDRGTSISMKSGSRAWQRIWRPENDL